MYAHDFALIDRGTDVYARDGRWIGTVGDVHAYNQEARAESLDNLSSTSLDRGGCLEVGTGFQRLGKSLYIPDSAVAHVCGAWVILDVPSAELDSLGWEERPA